LRVYLCTSVLSTRAFSSSIGAPRFRRRFAVKDLVSMGSVRMNLDRARWILNLLLHLFLRRWNPFRMKRKGWEQQDTAQPKSRERSSKRCKLRSEEKYRA
jgi:hypothetical protein